ncbi:MAG: HAD family hydrolase [Lachnospiraceae bacterium]
MFGRVTPAQKRQFVQALKAQGRTVAMTGDGVNDVLALKDADLALQWHPEVTRQYRHHRLCFWNPILPVCHQLYWKEDV